uniref:TFIIS N-terminal domain-containing protein n=1 Tax=Spermophilus dauricus TaxID=99837 RepID=A0A8C9PBJ5_SPEDA
MASEEVLLRFLPKLQGRLATRTRPDKLQKYLQQLSALPLTPHVLQETGVRKTVKSLRHHELLGGLARDLAARWKKLALLEADPGPGPHDCQLAEEITDTGSRENSRAPSSPSRRTGHGPENHRDLEESRRPHERSPSRQRREDGSKKRPRPAALPAPWRSWDGCPAQACGGPTGPHPMSGDHSASPEDTEPSAPLEGREPCIQDSSAGGWVVGWLGAGRGGAGRGRHPFPGESSTILYPESEPPKMEGVSREAAAVLPGTPSPSLWGPPSAPPDDDDDDDDDDALMSFFAPNATALSSPQKEEEAGFAGIRTNSRTPVYSGGKREHLAQTTWLPRGSQGVADQDSLWEERALPHSLFGSALENCTPEQLYQAERCHQGTAEETDGLWRLHCGQEFKGETPKENESWREMYLRLQDAREQRLRALTSQIRSRHPQEPRGRQTKMVYFKSPGEVPRRHGQFGTLAAAASGRPKFQPAQDPRGGSSSRAHRGAPVANTRKPKAKEIPPLLAKTLKDYRRVISRR